MPKIISRQVGKSKLIIQVRRNYAVIQLEDQDGQRWDQLTVVDGNTLAITLIPSPGKEIMLEVERL